MPALRRKLATSFAYYYVVHKSNKSFFGPQFKKKENTISVIFSNFAAENKNVATEKTFITTKKHERERTA